MDRSDFWTLVHRAAARALATGAIEPIPTRPLFIEHAGVRFLVRVVDNLRRKTRASAAAGAQAQNPFLPYDPELLVAALSPTHVALLNKFNVVEHHALFVTRAFEAQELPLTLEDFEAAWVALAAGPSLIFYNSGPVAGASQPHRHVQAVPVPLAEGPAVPIEAVLGSPDSAWAPGKPGSLHSAEKLPFRNVVGWLEPRLGEHPASAAAVTLELYRAALAVSGVAPPDAPSPRPYNLLLTRHWMLLVPRAREHFGSVSINALGFAGALLVRDEAELELVRRHGPMSVLREVALT